MSETELFTQIERIRTSLPGVDQYYLISGHSEFQNVGSFDDLLTAIGHKACANVRPERPGGDLLHIRHNRIAKGGDPFPRELVAGNSNPS